MTNTAAKVAAEKQAHPERFCASPRCLWRVVTRDGVKPCQKHPRTLAQQMLDTLSPESRTRLHAMLLTEG